MSLILQLVVWLPLVGAVVVALAGNGPTTGEGTSSRAWRIATFFAAVTFALAAWLLVGFDSGHADLYQFETRIAWLPFGSDLLLVWRSL